jgi:hypothetical protein
VSIVEADAAEGEMEDLKTVIEVHSAQNGTLIGVARTRSELEQLIGGQAWSRNEHGGWRQSDPGGQGSLDDLDEVATGFVRGVILTMRLVPSA